MLTTPLAARGHREGIATARPVRLADQEIADVSRHLSGMVTAAADHTGTTGEGTCGAVVIPAWPSHSMNPSHVVREVVERMEELVNQLADLREQVNLTDIFDDAHVPACCTSDMGLASD